MTKLEFNDEPPAANSLTSYDERHLATYLRLLDAEAEGADWAEIVRIVFGIDPAIHAGRARTVYDSHLARAHWMRNSGFRDLLQKN